jgi:1-deoxy-D-xylulose-5-phosphate synthase
MATGCGMAAFASKMPERFYDVGIEEEHAVTFAAGLAAGGLKPFCNIYSSFAQRAYDQIIHDVALQHLPVTLCFDRAGLVGEDGPTHHGTFDLAAYRSIPGLVIAAPSDEAELANLMYTALQREDPMIIRYPRGTGEGTAWRGASRELLEPGRARKLSEGSRIAVLALGPSAHRAAEAAEAFAKEAGFSPAVYDVRYLKPLDPGMLEEVSKDYEAVLTVEDGSVLGGLFGAVSEYLASKGSSIPVRCAGIPDRFIAQDTQAAERKECGLDRDGILAVLRVIVEKD